eukprot:1887998-Rhodomonas_salina.1
MHPGSRKGVFGGTLRAASCAHAAALAQRQGVTTGEGGEGGPAALVEGDSGLPVLVEGGVHVRGE